MLLQSGLDERWWSDSMECYCYLRNVQDLLADGETPYERRFGEPFEGPIIPFRALVEYHPISPKDQARIQQFGKKVLPGIFLGYALIAGRIWKIVLLVADKEKERRREGEKERRREEEKKRRKEEEKKRRREEGWITLRRAAMRCAVLSCGQSICCSKPFS